MNILRRRRKRKQELALAQAALAESKQQLSRTQERGREVDAVVQQLQDLRRRNHFAERLRPTMGGHP